MSKIEHYDVIVIGGGHAGIEAALASARLNKNTAMFVMNMDTIANMPCNPSIGGTSKGHLVREIDALGGQIGISADHCLIQSKMLNKSKGPAVHSLRAQVDRKEYSQYMKKILENQPNLDIYQSEVIEIIIKNKKAKGVITKTKDVYNSETVIVATGTYLKARVIIGDISYESGPDGVFASTALSESLKKNNIELKRFKTGTPARVNIRTMDLKKMEVQKGDEEIYPFSFTNENNKEILNKKQINCYLTYTNEETHKEIIRNIDKSPLYNGDIESIGPRYCPSIEDKVMRFRDKKKHQIFIEPVGENTNEMYVQGMSSSLPSQVQKDMYKTVCGLENAKLMRYAYAIEYDLIDATQLTLGLKHKQIEGLFFAGQINGSSGYEEAAAQGLIAGINATRFIDKKQEITLNRSEAYIGVLIDDLVTKGTNEPYRMMTSRAEYRLVLRQDNADLRLTELGYKIGLINEERYKKFVEKKQLIEQELNRIKTIHLKPDEYTNKTLLKAVGFTIDKGIKLSELLKRTEITYNNTIKLDKARPDLPRTVKEQVEIQLKYQGYIKLQQDQIQRFKKLEQKKLNKYIDYNSIKGLSLEAKQKLDAQKPESIGQASRISGVSPADVSILLIYLKQKTRRKESP